MFLQNYLSLVRQDEIPVAHLYATYRKTSEQPGAENAKGQLRRLRRYADIYRDFGLFPDGTRQGTFFRRLTAMELGTTHPFLMQLIAVHGKQAPEFVQTLEIIESYLVRRLVCQLTTRSYGRFFIDLIRTIEGPLAELPARVRGELLDASGESARWPEDEEFRNAWLSAPLYRTMLRARLRMILEALDAALETGYEEQYLIKDKLTVEHLLPQDWQEHWSLPANSTVERVTTRTQRIHTIGNLTLVTKKLNPRLSNRSWPEKVQALKKHVKLNLNHDLLNRWATDWNDATIIKRGELLFDHALRLWPR